MKKSLLFFLTATASLMLCAQREDPAKYWNDADLETVPAFKELADPIPEYENMKAISFDGYAFDGKKGPVKAVISLPVSPAPPSGYPAVMLLTPSGKYAQIWNSWGYAVMIVPGGKIQKFPGAVKCAENFRLAHSLLRSWPGIDKEKTGFIALSGGYGNLLAAADKRFKFGVNLYYGACNLKSKNLFNGRFLHATQVPMFWVVKANDPANCPLPSLQAAFSECASIKNKSIVVGLPVDYFGFRFGVTKRIADQVLKGEKPLPVLDKPVVNGNIISAKILDEGKGIQKSILCITKDKTLKKWEILPAKQENGTLSAELPADALLAYFSAYDDLSAGNNYFCGSSDVWQKDAK